MSTPTRDPATLTSSRVAQTEPSNPTVLILSSDVVGAALLGGLVETLGYRVTFGRHGERMADALRRERPVMVFVDASDGVLSAENLGPAQMRGVPVTIFGRPHEIERACASFADRPLHTLEMPAPIAAVEAAMKKSLAPS